MRGKAIAFLVFLILLALTLINAESASLQCDPQAGATQYQLEVNGVVGAAEAAQADTSYLRDLGGFAAGAYKFRLRAADASGWWSEWSDPLDVGRKEKPGGIRIRP